LRQTAIFADEICISQGNYVVYLLIKRMRRDLAIISM
jgi:hypothetical protein